MRKVNAKGHRLNMPYLFRMGKSIETASRLGVAKGWGQEEMDGA